jgi:tagatose-1,6-bisphosphate aldolase non-catalytic subunit AgaZ/GatZ
MPDEYQAIRDGRIKNSPEELIKNKISKVLNIYKYATTEEIN